MTELIIHVCNLNFQKSTNINMNDSRTMSEKRDQYMVEVMGRLVDALNRSSEVMNSAINTIETLAAPSPNKTSVPDDDSVLINSKRNDKVIRRGSRKFCQGCPYKLGFNCFYSSTYFTEDCTNLPQEAIGPKGSDCFSRVCTSISKKIYNHL